MPCANYHPPVMHTLPCFLAEYHVVKLANTGLVMENFHIGTLRFTLVPYFSA